MGSEVSLSNAPPNYGASLKRRASDSIEDKTNANLGNLSGTSTGTLQRFQLPAVQAKFIPTPVPGSRSGDCAIIATLTALECSPRSHFTQVDFREFRNNLANLYKSYDVFSQQQLTVPEARSIEVLANACTVIFGKDFATFRAYFATVLQVEIEAMVESLDGVDDRVVSSAEDSLQSIINFRDKLGQINSLQQLDLGMWNEILKRDLGVDYAHSIRNASLHRGSGNAIDARVKTSHLGYITDSGNPLCGADIRLYLLSKGIIQSKYRSCDMLNSRGNIVTHTILEFDSVSKPDFKFYIANDASPKDSLNNVRENNIGEGLHWYAVTRVNSDNSTPYFPKRTKIESVCLSGNSNTLASESIPDIKLDNLQCDSSDIDLDPDLEEVPYDSKVTKIPYETAVAIKTLVIKMFTDIESKPHLFKLGNLLKDVESNNPLVGKIREIFLDQVFKTKTDSALPDFTLGLFFLELFLEVSNHDNVPGSYKYVGGALMALAVLYLRSAANLLTLQGHESYSEISDNINDLEGNFTPEQVMQSLISMYQSNYAQGVTSLINTEILAEFICKDDNSSKSAQIGVTTTDFSPLEDNCNVNFVKVGDEVFTGDCGLQAMKNAYGLSDNLDEIRVKMVVTNVALFRLEYLIETVNSVNFTSLPSESQGKVLEQLKNNYIIVFNNLELFKSYLQHRASEELNATSSTSVHDAVCEFKALIASLASFDDISLDLWKLITKRHPEVLPKNMVEDSKHPWKTVLAENGHVDYNSLANALADNINTYQSYASCQGSWLDRDEICGMSLKLGFIQAETIFDDPRHNVIIAFQSLVNPGHRVYFANNAQIISSGKTDGRLVTGSHWYTVKPESNL